MLSKFLVWYRDEFDTYKTDLRHNFKLIFQKYIYLTTEDEKLKAHISQCADEIKMIKETSKKG